MKPIAMTFFGALLLSIVIIPVYAQISKGGLPKSFQTTEISDTIQTMVMPSINVDSLLVVDSLEESEGSPFRFGYAIDVSMGLHNSGTWDTLQNGDKIWRLKIKSQDAVSINLIFDDFWLPEGAEFFVYSGDKNMVLGGFIASISNNDYYKFSTDLIKGDATILEYYEPSYSIGGRINVDKIIHGYKNIFQESGHDNTSQTCYFDVTCSEGNEWCVEKRAVSMILTDNNTRICSGCLINNVREDLTPYYLTANHCLSGSETTWIFRFKYWSTTCNQGDDAGHWVSISGSTKRANHANSDFALLELNSRPPSGFGVLYAGWDRTSTPPTSSTVIHHPAGSTMKISFDNDPAVSSSWPGTSANSHWQITLDKGTTEGGSSGAPLFNQNHRIVGQNHGGNAGCPPVEKKYGRFDVSWDGGGTSATRLRDWLDPDNTGATSVGPTSPTIYLINRTLTGTHYFAALDKIHIEGNVITGGPFNNQFCQPSNIPFTAEPGSNVTIKAKSITIYPGTEFKYGSNVTITATDDIECGDNLVEGDYVDVFCNAQVSMKMAGNNASTENSTAKSEKENKQEKVNLSDNIILYPNPSSGRFEIEFTDGELKSSEIIIYDAAGKIIYEQNKITQNKVPIEFCSFQKGIYLVQIIHDNNSYTKKIVLQ